LGEGAVVWEARALEEGGGGVGGGPTGRVHHAAEPQMRGAEAPRMAAPRPAGLAVGARPLEGIHGAEGVGGGRVGGGDRSGVAGRRGGARCEGTVQHASRLSTER